MEPGYYNILFIVHVTLCYRPTFIIILLPVREVLGHSTDMKLTLQFVPSVTIPSEARDAADPTSAVAFVSVVRPAYLNALNEVIFLSVSIPSEARDAADLTLLGRSTYTARSFVVSLLLRGALS